MNWQPGPWLPPSSSGLLVDVVVVGLCRDDEPVLDDCLLDGLLDVLDEPPPPQALAATSRTASAISVGRRTSADVEEHARWTVECRRGERPHLVEPDHPSQHTFEVLDAPDLAHVAEPVGWIDSGPV